MLFFENFSFCSGDFAGFDGTDIKNNSINEFNFS